jgi:hypothetical protein
MEGMLRGLRREMSLSVHCFGWVCISGAVVRSRHILPGLIFQAKFVCAKYFGCVNEEGCCGVSFRVCVCG